MTHKTLKVLIYSQTPKYQGAILVKLKTTNSSIVTPLLWPSVGVKPNTWKS